MGGGAEDNVAGSGGVNGGHDTGFFGVVVGRAIGSGCDHDGGGLTDGEVS